MKTLTRCRIDSEVSISLSSLSQQPMSECSWKGWSYISGGLFLQQGALEGAIGGRRTALG